MANEFAHVTVGTELTQAEYELITGHQFNAQATGDTLYASSATQLSRLGIGSAGDILITSSGLPSWVHILQVQTNGLTVGLGASAPEPDQDGLHIWKATAGTVASAANTLVTLENSTTIILAFLTPNNVGAGFHWLDPESTGSFAGRLTYSHSTNAFNLTMAGSDNLSYTDGAFAFQKATVISTTAGALTFSPFTGSLLFTGTLALTGSRVTQSYHTNITSTNAVTVDSWGESKEQIQPYGGDALAILRETEVISFRHLLDRDASGRVKLGVRAESIHEPLALVEMDYGYSLGVGPALDTMGLTALNTRAIQQIEDIVRRLEQENQELRALVLGRRN